MNVMKRIVFFILLFSLCIACNRTETKIFRYIKTQNIDIGDTYVIDVPEGGFQDVIFEYDSSNRYLLKQGATSNSVRTGKFIGNVEITETIVVFTGRLKSARKLK